MKYKVHLSPPHMGGEEMRYIQEAFDTNWIAPYGPNIDAFEREMAQYIGISSTLALSSGTAGIHLALRWLGVSQGDLVFCSDLTFIGSCAAVLYEKCTPVFIDSEPDSWNMSPDALERALQWAAHQNRLPKAVIIVDLYGESANWNRLLPLCSRYGIPVIEDAAEAVGTEYHKKRCGCFGDIAVLSFNGNKILTTSGGGMVLSRDASAIEKMRFWSTQARDPFPHYQHTEYGYNYRMSNVCAGIGRGQLSFLPQKLSARKHIHDVYAQSLEDLPLQIKDCAVPNSTNYWLSLLTMETNQISVGAFVEKLASKGIESRPAWKPMHMQPLFEKEAFFSHDPGNGSVGADVFSRTVCLPSGDGMTETEQELVLSAIRSCFVR